MDMTLLAIFVTAFLLHNARGSWVSVKCEDGIEPTIRRPESVSGKPGKRGPPGPPGPMGPPGSAEPDSELRLRYDDKISELESQISEFTRRWGEIGTIHHPARSCQEVKSANASAENGLYHIIDKEGNIFASYCDMVTAGGGWTLVASVHENNMKGRCTTGDRWSSEHGNSAEHPHGDGFWENMATHGIASSASSDDYKSPGYFSASASNVMIWHVPNDTPMEEYENSAILKYHTETGFLSTYGGNLQKLFSIHYPMKSKTYRAGSDNGPAIPIIWDRGSNEKMVQYTPTSSRPETDAGYMQFRVINWERNAFALCPGVRMKASKYNVEHVCIGSTSNNIGHDREEEYCGDYAAKDWYTPQWSAPDAIMQSVVMIFYR